MSIISHTRIQRHTHACTYTHTHMHPCLHTHTCAGARTHAHRRRPSYIHSSGELIEVKNIYGVHRPVEDGNFTDQLNNKQLLFHSSPVSKLNYCLLTIISLYIGQKLCWNFIKVRIYVICIVCQYVRMYVRT